MEEDPTTATTAEVERSETVPVQWENLSASELAKILDETYAEEVARRRERSAQIGRDAGERFLRALLIGVPVGLAIWGGMIALLIVLL